MSAGAAPAKLDATNPQDQSTGGLKWYFGFFFFSGFCSLLYELVWLRLAMAQFGVTTPMISIVLSSFMAGLGVGSWAGGRLVQKYTTRMKVPALQLYAVTEMLIGCSAVIVPLELLAGRFVLEHLGSSLSLSSGGYYIAAGIWVGCTLTPWCACMGATIPLAMSAIRAEHRTDPKRSFSFLYLANVLGAIAGTLIPLLLIELWGFNRTLQCGMLLNLLICATAFRISRQNRRLATSDEQPESAAISPAVPEMLRNSSLWLLFATGLTSMGMEVVWTRQFTIYVGTLVYSFATILGVYLGATFLGSMLYRWKGRQRNQGSFIWLLVFLAALLPLLTADPRLGIAMWLRLPLGIAAFSGLLGFLTPKLVDRFSEGNPDRAGVAYAVNVAGCILGPLVAGFLLLPYTDERFALAILALPWLFTGLFLAFRRPPEGSSGFAAGGGFRTIALALILLAAFSLLFRTQSYVDRLQRALVRRDNTATVLAVGDGMGRGLVVNGVLMTSLTPITKVMADLPLALLNHAPQNALVICFGMGTTHRSMLSWGIDSTVVDLVPSVPTLFSYFHADGEQLLRSPRSHVVIDDGRRFLERSRSQYDVIAIDPPPPIGAAGSSLLYSREFYSAAKKRLRPGGILAQWYPGGDPTDAAAISRALHESFPHVRAFVAYGGFGVHFLASMQPIPRLSASQMARRMPTQAAADFVEWGPNATAEQQFAVLLKSEVPIEWLISFDNDAPALQDDRPINEYTLLRTNGFRSY